MASGLLSLPATSHRPRNKSSLCAPLKVRVPEPCTIESEQLYLQNVYENLTETPNVTFTHKNATNRR